MLIISLLQKKIFTAIVMSFLYILYVAHPSYSEDKNATIPRIAIISAFDAELAKLRDSTSIASTVVINGRTHYIGRLAGHDVVLLLSGYSMVNAAMTSQSLFDHFNIKSVIFSGIAGGVNPGLHIGDVTVPSRWGCYQEQTFARKTDAGWDPGRFTAEFGNFGMMFPRAVSVTIPYGMPDSLERKFWFPVDSSGLKYAKQIASTIKLRRCVNDSDCLDHDPSIVVGGNGVSGPTFVDNAEYRTWVWSTFSADALDMETAAVALVSYINKTPFIAFRSLSDLAGGGKDKNEARIFGKLAAENSATVVLAYLRILPTATVKSGVK
jgi:adenosylhomocysteine nucleosidase